MCPTFCLAKVAEFKYNKGRSNTIYIFNILHFYIMQQRWSQHYLHFQYFKLLKLHMGREPAMSGIMRQRYISPHLCMYIVQKSKILHMTDISPHIPYVIFATNARYASNEQN